MNTWNAEQPPDLPPPTLGGRIAGLLRMMAFILLTASVLAVFLTGRTLRAWLGRRVTYHFLAAQFWARAGLWLTGLRLVIRGKPVASGALVSNHCSWADILTLRAVKLMYFVAKAEVRRWPAIGFITSVTGTVFIERRRSQAKQQEQALRERIAASQLLIFFPEATSTDGLRVLPFKSSLFSAFFHDHQAADLWIQPVTVRYAPAPGSGLPPSFYGWWGDMALGSHIWAVMSRSFGGRAEVIFHQPVKPRAFRDRKALAEHCGAVVARGLTEED
jgi:1-acyl-sn-glycerol-3-phosphate acyltransferase